MNEPRANHGPPSLPASAAEQLYARAIAALERGKDDEARTDLEAALPQLGDKCAVELAYLDIRQRTALEHALAVTISICERSGTQGFVAARAWHIRGLALGKLRRAAEATEALLRARSIYAAADDLAREAQVDDTLGMLLAAEGKLESAVGYFATSLAKKSVERDVYGMALSLGNLGRLHLRAGRLLDAQRCFELDLRLAQSIEDRRGIARMLDDLGRVRIALGQFDDAIRDLSRCVSLAREHALVDLEFFAHKDLASALVARATFSDDTDQERLREAVSEIQLARRALDHLRESGGGEPYLESLLVAVEGEIAKAQRDPRAIDLLERAALEFGRGRLPDLEIPTLITLAEALVDARLRESAARCLTRALQRARRDGYARYLPVVREAMQRLSQTESAVEERGRLKIEGGDTADPDGYTIIKKVGSGGFGDVFQALDPRRDRIVAIKVLRLETLYDERTRARVRASALLEVEAASRIPSHPGIAAVYAIGTDVDGRTYVVQEFVEGECLRSIMPRTPTSDIVVVISAVEAIASSLQALHDRGIVHRDVKPENVILRDRTSLPVLVDLGIALLPTVETELHGRARIGTLGYMAPEQFSGSVVDGRSDVFALGVVLYEWLTGTRPFAPLDPRRVRRNASPWATTPTPILEYRPKLDPEIVRLVHSMLDHRKRRRPAASAVAENCSAIVTRIEARP